MERNRVGLFVDCNNTYYAVNKRFPGRKLDYTKLYVMAKEYGEVFQANAYGDQRNGSSRQFIITLKTLGYSVKFAEQRLVGINKCNHNWSVNIAVDMLSIVDKVDTFVLGTIDPDIEPAINAVRARGANVIIISANINQTLRRACTSAIELIESDLMALPVEQPSTTE